MSRFKRILRIVTAILAGLFLLVVVSGIIIVQTQWFRDFVRTKIVTAVETATGGKTDIGSFTFDWRHLRAQIRNFNIHGLEPARSQPLFHANLVQVDLKLLSPFNGFVNIAYLLLDTPQANVIVYPDGHTNIPAPNVPAKSSNKTGLETIVDLAIGHFDLRNGSFAFGNQQSHLDASGANFRAQLGYNAVDPSYTGQIDISPLHLRNAANAPLDVDIQVPVTAHKDQVQIANAQFSTQHSHIVISGTVDHLIAPRTNAHINAQIALEDVRNAAALKIPLDLVHGPRTLSADITAAMDQQSTRIQSARITLGNTNIEASGDLKEANGGKGATFNATLDLNQLGTLLEVAARPQGTVKLGGSARMDAQNNYAASGNIEAHQLAFRSGTTRISNVNFDSGVSVDPHRIALSNLRLNAFGGRFTGDAALQDMAEFQVNGSLSDFNLETVSRTFLDRKLGYNGMVSGPVQASGNINHMDELGAKINLAIAPVPRAPGVPVSGKLNAGYSGKGNTVTLATSYIALPHTRVDLSGELNRQINVKAVSHNLADFQPVAGDIPVTLAPNGAVNLNATVAGNLSSPRIGANLAVTNFSAQGRPFNSLTADIAASPSNVAVTNAVIARNSLQMQLSANAGLRNWKPLPTNSLRADATIRNADVADVLALAEQTSIPATGAFTLDAHVNGTIGSPVGTVDVSATNGTIDRQKYDALTMHAEMTPNAITVPTLSLTSGPARLDANAQFQHPTNDMAQGTITAHVAANQVQLAQFQSLVKDRPGLAGSVTLNADGSATLRASQFDISSVTANVSARNLAMQGDNLGDFTATANTAGTAVQYNVTSNFAGSNIRVV
ncbi:MAG TPA: hypothetical protein VHW24_19040, partial [Bryobacteraceae bacterium]|nr:hypothetical protein [Bryobacteraceae bacterium]